MHRLEFKWYDLLAYLKEKFGQRFFWPYSFSGSQECTYSRFSAQQAKARCRLTSQSKSRLCKDPNFKVGIHQEALLAASSAFQPPAESLNQPVLPTPQPGDPVSTGDAEQRACDWQCLLSAQWRPRTEQSISPSPFFLKFLINLVNVQRLPEEVNKEKNHFFRCVTALGGNTLCHMQLITSTLLQNEHHQKPFLYILEQDDSQ